MISSFTFLLVLLESYEQFNRAEYLGFFIVFFKAIKIFLCGTINILYEMQNNDEVDTSNFSRSQRNSLHKSMYNHF